jgi:hypothetical protein
MLTEGYGQPEEAQVHGQPFQQVTHGAVKGPHAGVRVPGFVVRCQAHSTARTVRAERACVNALHRSHGTSKSYAHLSKCFLALIAARSIWGLDGTRLKGVGPIVTLRHSRKAIDLALSGWATSGVFKMRDFTARCQHAYA